MLKGFRLVALVIIVALSGMVTVVYELANPQISPQNVYLDIETDKNSYGLNENVNITISIVNKGYGKATFYFNTDYQYDLIVYDLGNNEVFNLYENFTICNSSTNVILYSKSEKALLEEYTWNRADKNGKQVQPGNYRIHAKLIGYNISDEKQINIGEHREIYIKAITEKNVYKIGENVSIHAYLVNEGDANITFFFGGCAIESPAIYQDDSMVFLDPLDCIWSVWFWEIASRGLNEGVAYHGFNMDWEPVSKKTDLGLYPYVWNQTNDTGELIWDSVDKKAIYPDYYTQVPPGMYTIQYLLAGVPVDSVSPEYSKLSLGYEVVGFKSILIIQ